MEVTKKNIGKRVTWEDAKGTPVVGTIIDVRVNVYDGEDNYIIKTGAGKHRMSEKRMEKMGVELW